MINNRYKLKTENLLRISASGKNKIKGDQIYPKLMWWGKSSQAKQVKQCF